MFLYNMVTETKEELKTEIANAKKVKEALERTVETKREDGKTTASGTKKKEADLKGMSGLKEAPAKKSPVKREEKQSKSNDEIAALLAATVAVEPEVSADGDMPKEKILELYKKGKSVREISRELGMGQGEVKLVIDLYGL